MDIQIAILEENGQLLTPPSNDSNWLGSIIENLYSTLSSWNESICDSKILDSEKICGLSYDGNITRVIMRKANTEITIGELISNFAIYTCEFDHDEYERQLEFIPTHADYEDFRADELWERSS